MPEVTIEIGGKGFEVACQAGEEQYLQAAAKMLDTEARTLIDHLMKSEWEGRFGDVRAEAARLLGQLGG